jgi:very-short-patch-repair endonuclease
MKNLPTLLLVVIALALLLAAAARFLPRAAPLRFRRTPLLTANETEFYVRLLHALPGLLVLPQVALAALIEPDVVDSRKRLAAFRRISQKRADYVIARSDLSVLCVIELDDRTHDPRRDAQRDQWLASAGIRTLRYASSRKPNEAQIAAEVQQLQVSSSNRDARP